MVNRWRGRKPCSCQVVSEGQGAAKGRSIPTAGAAQPWDQRWFSVRDEHSKTKCCLGSWHHPGYLEHHAGNRFLTFVGFVLINHISTFNVITWCDYKSVLSHSDILRCRAAANTSTKAAGGSHACFRDCLPFWEILSLQWGLYMPQKTRGKAEVLASRFLKKVLGKTITISWRFAFSINACWRDFSPWGDSLDHAIKHSTSLETNCTALSFAEFCGCLSKWDVAWTF